MRIVYLNPVGCVGGAERVLLSVMKAARQADPSLQAHLITATDGPLLPLAEEMGVRTMLLPMSDAVAAVGDSKHRDSGWFERSRGMIRQVAIAPNVWKYSRQLRATLRKIAPDLIHSNGIKSHLLTRLAGARSVVWHVHDFYGDRPLVRWMLRWATKGVLGAISISKAVDRDVRALVPKLPTRVIPNALDVDAFAPAATEPGLLEQLAGLPATQEGTIRVGLVATYARWKGHDVFLQAAARLLQQQPSLPVRFYLIGGPIYQTQGSQYSLAELRSLAGGLGLDRHLGFINFQQNPAPIYRALDVVVHASTRPEPFGLTIIEAMACGRAVIVAQAGGAAELFTPDYDAVGFPPGEAAALASAIAELVKDPQRRRRLGDNARQTIIHRFNQNRLGPQIQEAYRTFLEGGAACSIAEQFRKSL